VPSIYGRTPFSANVHLDDGRFIYVSMIGDRATGELEIAVFPRRWIHRLAALLWPVGALLLPPPNPGTFFWSGHFETMVRAQAAFDRICAELEGGTSPERLVEVLPGVAGRGKDM